MFLEKSYRYSNERRIDSKNTIQRCCVIIYLFNYLLCKRYLFFNFNLYSIDNNLFEAFLFFFLFFFRLQSIIRFICVSRSKPDVIIFNFSNSINARDFIKKTRSYIYKRGLPPLSIKIIMGEKIIA